MADPLVFLLTDFGHRDHYVGVVKAVIAGLEPRARFVDLTHEVPPQDVEAGAFLLWASLEYLPAGAIVLGVVDPGVGSDRRAVAVRARGLTLVGPDNGLFAWALRGFADRAGTDRPSAGDSRLRLTDGERAVELDRPQHWLTRRSATFHGRDVFAPVAARLASGAPLATLGTATDWLVDLDWPGPRQVSPTEVAATVVYVDVYGNLFSNFSPPPGSAVLEVRIAGRRIVGMSAWFDPSRELVTVVGSNGLLEIAAPGGSAAALLGVGRGAEVLVRLGAPLAESGPA